MHGIASTRNRLSAGAVALALALLGCESRSGAGPDPDAFVTLWDTSLANGATVTLALAGTVDATIDWGDGTVSPVTGPGPHVHDYDAAGVYTGGSAGERTKLVEVVNWGSVGFTSLHSAFRGAVNLTNVPSASIGIEGVTNMSTMFSEALAFNQDIGGWDTSEATDLSSMFWGAISFNQDLSGWCVPRIGSQPFGFDLVASTWTIPNSRPVWRSCP